MILLGTLLAWLPFVSPAMLWWGLAASAPLIIHLLSKRKYRETTWAAMRYLLAAVKKSTRRIQIEQWLLLAIRTLILLLLAGAVAQPYLEQVGVGLIQGQRTHKVLVIDGSYSMAYRPGDKSIFERAKEVAQEIVDHSGKGDGFTLILMTKPPRAIVHTPAFEPGDFKTEIANLRLPHGTADVPAALVSIEQILADARRDVPKLTREEVFILSDLGRSSWVSEQGDDAKAEFLERARRLGEKGTSLVVIDLGRPDAENLAVTKVGVKQAFATVDQDVQIEAQLRNFGRQAKNRQRIELLIDGRPAAEQQVDLAGGQERTVIFSHQFGHGGEHALEVRLASDQLDLDNHRWLSLEVKEYIRVLCVNGRPTGDPATGATGYLQVALRPSESFRGRAVVRPDVLGEEALQEIPDLSRYDCIFLADVKQFIGAEARRLDSYLKTGGGLVVFLGEQVQPESYNRLLGGGEQGGVRILPAKIGALVVGDPQNAPTLDALDYKHPALEKFQGNPLAGLLQSTVLKHYELKLPEPTRASVVLGIKGGGPLIVEEPIHRGRSILVGTSADATWTTLPLLNAYVPLVHELLRQAISGRSADHNKLVGEPIDGAVRNAGRQPPGKVLKPHDPSAPTIVPGKRDEQDVESVQLVPDGDDSVYSYKSTETSGVYQVDFGPPLARREVFAVNLQTHESDLTHLEESELAAEILPGVNYSHWTGRQDLEDEPVTQIGKRNELHLMLLYTALALLFVETLLAWKFGHHRPAK
jgi:hypothetical protein